jgi:hypothetical protein
MSLETSEGQKPISRSIIKVKELKLHFCDYPDCTKKYSQSFRLDIHRRTHVR